MQILRIQFYAGVLDGDSGFPVNLKEYTASRYICEPSPLYCPYCCDYSFRLDALVMSYFLKQCSSAKAEMSCSCAEALPFLRDPYAYEEEEPFGQMMTAPIRDQMYKAVTGFAIMACLAVACIHVPVQLAKAISPGLFPLHLKVSSPKCT